jgi:hypothetical protein
MDWHVAPAYCPITKATVHPTYPFEQSATESVEAIESGISQIFLKIIPNCFKKQVQWFNFSQVL